MQQFAMKLCNKLLIKIRMNGIDPTQAVLFFGQQATLMLDCPPNYGPKSKKTTNAKDHQLKTDVWLMRGFYPGTAQMFKISIAKNPAYDHVEYYVKISEPKINPPTNRGNRHLPVAKDNQTIIYSNVIKDTLQNTLEKEVLGVDIPIESLINSKVVFTPKCISPKGMKRFNLDIKKD